MVDLVRDEDRGVRREMRRDDLTVVPLYAPKELGEDGMDEHCQDDQSQ